MAQRKATNTEAVLEAAARVFQQKGYELATLDDIAAEAGVSKPTIYRYAKSKQWMLDRIVLKVQAEIDERAAAVIEPGLTGLERLRLQVLITIETGMSHKSYYQVAMVQSRASSPRAAKDFRDWARAVTNRVRVILEQAIDEGSLDLQGEPATYANLLAGMLASIHRWVNPSGPLSADELTDYVMHLLSAASRDDLVPAPASKPASGVRVRPAS